MQRIETARRMSLIGQSVPMRTPLASYQVRNSLKADFRKRYIRSRIIKRNLSGPKAVSSPNTDKGKRLPAQCGLLLTKALASAPLGDAFNLNPQRSESRARPHQVL